MEQNNNQVKLTTLDDWASKFMQKCSCIRGVVATYYCQDENCQDHKQIFFCIECYIEDKKHLSHDPISIKNALGFET